MFSLWGFLITAEASAGARAEREAEDAIEVDEVVD